MIFNSVCYVLENNFQIYAFFGEKTPGATLLSLFYNKKIKYETISGNSPAAQTSAFTPQHYRRKALRHPRPHQDFRGKTHRFS